MESWIPDWNDTEGATRMTPSWMENWVPTPRAGMASFFIC